MLNTGTIKKSTASKDKQNQPQGRAFAVYIGHRPEAEFTQFFFRKMKSIFCLFHMLPS